jgi:hypothetical protein
MRLHLETVAVDMIRRYDLNEHFYEHEDMRQLGSILVKHFGLDVGYNGAAWMSS